MLTSRFEWKKGNFKCFFFLKYQLDKFSNLLVESFMLRKFLGWERLFRGSEDDHTLKRLLCSQENLNENYFTRISLF